MLSSKYQPGALVVYTMTKQSASPGKRARKIVGSPRGEDYRYMVDKYWIVEKSSDDGQLVIRTRRGKTRTLDINDQSLRPASIFEKLFLRKRFPSNDE